MFLSKEGKITSRFLKDTSIGKKGKISVDDIESSVEGPITNINTEKVSDIRKSISNNLGVTKSQLTEVWKKAQKAKPTVIKKRVKKKTVIKKRIKRTTEPKLSKNN